MLTSKYVWISSRSFFLWTVGVSKSVIFYVRRKHGFINPTYFGTTSFFLVGNACIPKAQFTEKKWHKVRLTLSKHQVAVCLEVNISESVFTLIFEFVGNLLLPLLYTIRFWNTLPHNIKKATNQISILSNAEKSVLHFSIFILLTFYLL